MKKSLLTILSISLAFSSPIIAENEFEILDIGDITLTETQTEDGKFKTWWNEHISGKLGAMTAGGAGNSTRTATSFILGYKQTFPKGKFHLEGQTLSSKNEVKFTKENETIEGPNERTIAIQSNETRLREAYIDYNFTDSLMLSLGRQTIVWGQFDLFSPIDFALPFDFSQSGMTFSKVDRRLPQDAAKLSWFATPKTEIQLYYFPDYPSDHIINSQVSEELRETILKPSSSDDDQQAVRLMFYQDWGTVGLTYYKGFDAFASYLSKITKVDGEFSYKEQVAITEKTVYGIEIAKPVGSFVWKFEISREEDIVFEPTDYPHLSDSNHNDYRDFVANENDGNLFAPANRYFIAAGFDADLEKWLINFSVIGYQEELSDKAQKLKDFSDATRSSEDDSDGFDTNIFPMFNISRYLDKNKNGRLGLGLGFLNQGMGVSFYWTKEYRESLRLIAALESVLYFDAIDQDLEGYEAESEFTSGLRIGAMYTF